MFIIRLFIIMLLLSPGQIMAAGESIVINELQAGSEVSASQEFIELYNPTDYAIPIEGWKLEYKSATSENSWSRKATLAGTILARGYLLVAPTAYLSTADAELTTGLAAAGGHIRLVDQAGNVVDLVGWGTANAPEASVAPAAAAGETIGRLSDIDSGNNQADFSIQSPTPRAPNEVAIVAEEPEAAPVSYATIDITELLPDPTSPATDAEDEFIELYNPNDYSADLTGYSLETGSDWRDRYELTGQINARSYLVLYSRQSHLSLPNSGGAARLLDPDGNVVAETAAYDKAPIGQAWVLLGEWQWSTSATPAKPNQITRPIAKEAAAKPAKAKKPAAIKAKTSRVKSSGTAQTPAARVEPTVASAKQPQPASKSLLIIIGVAVLSYAVYEFRHDLRNGLQLARRYLRFGRSSGRSS